MHSHWARHRVVLTGALLLAVATACTSGDRGASAPPTAPMTRPNIVFILLDDVRYDDLIDHPFVDLPNLKRLAAEGASFRRFFTSAPLCSPSRAAEMTGHVPLALRHSPTLRRACAKSRAQRCDQEFDVAEASARV